MYFDYANGKDTAPTEVTSGTSVDNGSLQSKFRNRPGGPRPDSAAPPSGEFDILGLRVAAVPEPSTLWMMRGGEVPKDFSTGSNDGRGVAGGGEPQNQSDALARAPCAWRRTGTSLATVSLCTAAAALRNADAWWEAGGGLWHRPGNRKKPRRASLRLREEMAYRRCRPASPDAASSGATRFHDSRRSRPGTGWLIAP